MEGTTTTVAATQSGKDEETARTDQSGGDGPAASEGGTCGERNVKSELSCASGAVSRIRSAEEADGGVGTFESPIRKRLKYGRGASMLTCENCYKRFRRQSMFEVHTSKFGDDKQEGDKMQRGIVIAHDIVYKENIIEVYVRLDEKGKLNLVDFDPDVDCRTVNVGWAKRTKWREDLGVNNAQ